MKTFGNRKLVISTALLISALSVTGCTSTQKSTDAHHGSTMMGTSNESAFSAADIMFAQMMIPHHQQAVDMGTLVETRAANPDVKELAAQIKAEQAPEIIQMTSWLKAANASMTMDHVMGMGGMLSESDMQELESTSGEAFDSLYLQGMIAHHKGAIQMADMVMDSSNAAVQALSKAIIQSQTQQITYMETLLGKLGS